MYEAIRMIHGLIRWVVLVDIAVLLAFTFIGWMKAGKWSPRERVLGLTVTILFDIQTLLGLIMYFFLSPVTTSAFSNMGAAMKNKEMRFFAVEHIVLMILALVCVHIAAVISRKTMEDTTKFKKVFLYTAVAFVLILAGNPWFRPLPPGG